MLLDNLTATKFHTPLDMGVDNMLPSNAMVTMAKNYLIACKVEGKTPRTLSVYAMALERYLRSQMGSDPNGIRRFLLSLQEQGLSPASIHIYYRSLRTFFNWLVIEKFIKDSPMANIKPPKLTAFMVKPFTEEDIKKLLIHTAGMRFVDVRNRAILLMFLDTGLRLAEMAGLQLADINWERETAEVLGKGNKERLVRIGKVTQKALLKYILMRRDEHPELWVNEEREPLTISGIQTIINKLTRRAGITGCKLGPHTLRHTAAINYLRHGGDEFTLQLMLGHTSLAMTRRYVSTLGTDDLLRVHKKASPVDNLKF